MNSRNDRLSTVLISLVVASLLMIVPLPGWLDAMRPYWVGLVLIFWALETTDLVNLGLAFVTGLLLDLLTISLLGLHALSLVVLLYLVIRFKNRIRFFPPWQQALSVLALLLNDRIILLWIISLRGEPTPGLSFWLPPIVGTLLWPWLFVLLDYYRSAMRKRGGS